MKPLIIILLISSCVTAQTTSPPPVKLKNWRERMYRAYKVEDVENAKKNLDAAQDTLDRLRATPNPSYPAYLSEQEARVAQYAEDLKTAEADLAKLDAMLINPEIRKAFNKEAQSIFKRRNQETAAKYSVYPSTPSAYRRFRIDCTSGGYGRRFWVRCTSISY